MSERAVRLSEGRRGEDGIGERKKGKGDGVRTKERGLHEKRDGLNDSERCCER